MTLKSKLDHANKRVEKMETELRGDKDEPKKEDGKSPNQSSKSLHFNFTFFSL